jgi:hypothetical protein
MYRLILRLVCLSVLVCGCLFASTAASAAEFSQCPAVGADTGCQYLITVSNLGVSLATDPSQPSFANNLAATHETGVATDALVGVQNDSPEPLASLNVTGPITFEFDGDGICDNASGAVPQGCKTPSGSTTCGADDGPCSFPPPAGEPTNYTDFGAPPGNPTWPNGDVQNGYEGPTSWFSNIGPSPNNSGTVNFSPPVPPGGSTYFGLEAGPKNLPITTSLSTAQTAAGETGPVLYLPDGTQVRSTAELTGGNGHPSGQVTFRLFRNATCSGGSISAGATNLPSAKIASSSVLMSKPGAYYWQAEYAGDGTNAPVASKCGAQSVVIPRAGALGLPSSGRCVSELTARLRVGKHAARKAEVFENGKLVGRFGGEIRVRIRKRERVAVIASSARGAFGGKALSPNLFRQQSRTYRPC